MSTGVFRRVSAPIVGDSTKVREEFEEECRRNPEFARQYPLAIKSSDDLPVSVRDFTPIDKLHKVKRAFCMACYGQNAVFMIARNGKAAVMCKTQTCGSNTFSSTTEGDSLLRGFQRVCRDNPELVEALKTLVLNEALNDIAEVVQHKKYVDGLARQPMPTKNGNITVSPSDTKVKRFRASTGKVRAKSTP